MNKDWKLFSFYTIDTPYEDHAKVLEESVKKYNVENYEILGVPTAGSWAKNDNLKPENILAALKRYKCNLLWVDADAELLRYPSIIDNIARMDYDLSMHHLEVSKLHSTGTVYIKYSIAMVAMVEEWVKRCKAGQGMEQDLFTELAMGLVAEKKIKFFNLPADYYAVEDINGGLGKSQTFDIPAIIHHQASRVNNPELRKKLYGK